MGGAVHTVTTVPGGGFYHLLDPNRRWYNNRRLMLLHVWIFLALITSATNGYDGSMMNGLQSLEQWRGYYDNPHGSRLGVLNAIQTIGSLGGQPFAPYVTDILGRRAGIFLGAFITCCGVALQTASYNFGMFIGSRFLIGFGLTFAINASPLLVTEVAYPAYRAPLTSLYNSLWYLGAIIAAWTTFGTAGVASSWSWRIPSVLQALPSIAQVFLIWFAPESPRWLVAKGRDREAIHTLAYYHADGDEEDPLVRFEYEEIKTAIDLDRASMEAIGYKTLFTTPGNRHRLRVLIPIAFFSQWSGNNLIAFYLNEVFKRIGITSSTTQLLINGILQIWNLFWAVTAAFSVERAGRRLLFLTSAAGMLVFFTAQTICSARFAISGTDSAAHAVIAFIFLFYAFYDLAFTPLIASYTVEVLPYALRAKGFNLFLFMVNLSLIFNQYVNPVALEALGWKYYIVYCVWLAFELAYLYFTVIETKGLPLEQIATLFDGDAVTRQLAHAHEVHDAGVLRSREDGPMGKGKSEKV